MFVDVFQGSIHLYEAGTPESLKLLKDIHCGSFVGICCLVGSDYCVVGDSVINIVSLS